MIILGAGATAHSYYANRDRRPPLLRTDDIRRAINSARVFPDEYSSLILKALPLYNGDTEKLFTAMYIAEHHELFSEDERQEYKVYELEKIAKEPFDRIMQNTFNNALTFFQGALEEEIQRCIGTTGKTPLIPPEMLVCKWHRIIASRLNHQDVVVNFNYDPIMTYALLNEKKLTAASFINSHIKAVNISQKFITDKPIILLTPHGSFTWRNNIIIDEKVYLKEVYKKILPELTDYATCGLLNEADLLELLIVNPSNFNYFFNCKRIPENIYLKFNKISRSARINIVINIASPCGVNNNLVCDSVLLPLRKKTSIFNLFPHMEEEYSLFLDKLKQAKEIHLIGKQFKTADEDIAEHIKNVCHSCEPKYIVYANPEIKHDDWVRYHNDIFNAKACKCFESLESYIDA